MGNSKIDIPGAGGERPALITTGEPGKSGRKAGSETIPRGFGGHGKFPDNGDYLDYHRACRGRGSVPVWFVLG
jgi:hypothetical protein